VTGEHSEPLKINLDNLIPGEHYLFYSGTECYIAAFIRIDECYPITHVVVAFIDGWTSYLRHTSYEELPELTKALL
jgi:hypothetical protein